MHARLEVCSARAHAGSSSLARECLPAGGCLVPRLHPILLVPSTLCRLPTRCTSEMLHSRCTAGHNVQQSTVHSKGRLRGTEHCRAWGMAVPAHLIFQIIPLCCICMPCNGLLVGSATRIQHSGGGLRSQLKPDAVRCLAMQWAGLDGDLGCVHTAVLERLVSGMHRCHALQSCCLQSRWKTMGCGRLSTLLRPAGQQHKSTV